MSYDGANGRTMENRSREHGVWVAWRGSWDSSGDGAKAVGGGRIPHGTAGPARRCCSAVPAGGLGVVRAVGGCWCGGWGPCGRVRERVGVGGGGAGGRCFVGAGWFCFSAYWGGRSVLVGGGAGGGGGALRRCPRGPRLVWGLQVGSRGFEEVEARVRKGVVVAEGGCCDEVAKLGDHPAERGSPGT
jgi:hypothetical protein